MKYIYLLIITLCFSFTGLAQNSINSIKGQRINTSTTKVTQPEADRTKAELSVEKVETPLEFVKDKKEDFNKRDVYSKHFINDDGSYTALIGSGPIHYEKDGQFLDIDLDIKTNSDAVYPYANTANLFESYFGATAHEGVKNKTKEGELKEFLNTKLYWEVNGAVVNAMASANTAVTIEGDKAYYNNLYGNINAEFITESGRRKLNYIIPNASSLGNVPTGADYLTFTEDIVIQNGWSHTVSEKGIVIKNQRGKATYLYANPISTDASNTLSREKNTIYETSLNGNILTILTKVKTDWLLSADRQYPVKVDPTVSVSPNNVTNWTGHVWGDGYYDNSSVLTGYYDYTWIQGALRFNLSSIPDGSTVTAATGFINILGGYGTGVASRTWALTNCSDPLGISVGYNTQATALYNSMTAAHSQTTGVTSLGWRSSLFSPSGRTYLQNAIVNDFVAMGLYAMGTYNSGQYFETAGRTSANRPYISISYTVPSGCSGTPTAGTTVLTPTTGTYGSTFEASVTGSTVASGITYQWQSAPTSTGTWTNIVGATSATATFTAPNEIDTTYYRRMITCTNSAMSSYSNAVSYATTCTPSYINGNCAGVGDCRYIGISKVSIGTINFTSGYANVAPAYNNYYATQSTDVNEGSSNTLSVTYSDDGSPVNLGKIGAWVDWNTDGDFDDVNEFIGVTGNVNDNQVVTFTVTVPSGSSIGAKRLRVRSSFNDDVLISTDACTIKDYGETEDYSLNVLAAPVTYTFNGTWSPSDPNGVAAAGDDIVIASGDATINTNTTCNTVSVNPGAGLTVDTGITLTATNGVLLESSSTSYSSLIRNGSIVGTLEYKRHVNINGSGTTGSNDLISAPLTGQAFNTFATANPNILNNGTLYLFGPFDKVVGDYLTWAGTETTTLNAAVGYRAATSDNSVVTFTGTAENGTVTNDIDNSGSEENEWNLIGNPYPSYLNVQDFLNHEVSTGVSNLTLMDFGTAAIYGYDGSALDGWIIYNLANTTASTVITPGQGFFVSADATKTAAYDLEFSPNMRRTGSGDDFIAGRNAELVYLILNITSNSKSYDTEFYFNSNASEGFDFGYDAEVWGGTAPDFGIYSHLVQDNAGQPMALQTLNSTNLNDISIPLGVNASQGEQITFSIADMTLPTSVNVYLEDVVLNTITLLNTSDYVFTPTTALSGTGRFFLRSSSEALSNPEENLNSLQIYTSVTPRVLYVNGQLASTTTVSLYDIQGRMVASSVLDTDSYTNQLDVSNLSSGVYVVKLSNTKQHKTQKVIIK